MAAPRAPGTDHELHKRRLGRNIFVGGILLALVALIFFVTLAKFQTA